MNTDREPMISEAFVLRDLAREPAARLREGDFLVRRVERFTIRRYLPTGYNASEFMPMLKSLWVDAAYAAEAVPLGEPVVMVDQSGIDIVGHVVRI